MEHAVCGCCFCPLLNGLRWLQTGVYDLYYSVHTAPPRPSPSNTLCFALHLLFAVHPGPCPPGPLGKHCRDDHGDSGNDGSGSDNGSNGDNADNGGNDANAAAAEDDSSSSSSSSSNKDGTGGSNLTSGGMKKNMPMIALLVAACAATAALVAAIVGQRRERQDKHQLAGAVSRRINLFSALAQGELCAGHERPDRIYEMKGDHSMS